MDSLVLEGRIIQKLEVQDGVSTRGPWRKQDFIIETADQYPKKICICCWNEKIDELSTYNENDSVRVGINIESREYNNRWYTDIKAWKLEAVSVASGNPPSDSNASSNDDITGMSFSEEDAELPF